KNGAQTENCDVSRDRRKPSRLGAARRLRQIPDPLAGRPLRVGVLHRVEQLLHELRREVHAPDDDARDVPVLDLVVDTREGDRELVVREADVREVRVDARQVLRVEVQVELALRAVGVHWSGYYSRGFGVQ